MGLTQAEAEGEEPRSFIERGLCFTEMHFVLNKILCICSRVEILAPLNYAIQIGVHPFPE